MEKKIKIVLINHTYQINYYSRRWELLAEMYPNLDVTLLTPSKQKWYNQKGYNYGQPMEMKGREVEKNNFHIRLFRPFIKNTWLSLDMKKLLLDIQPDIVYHVGTQSQPSIVQMGCIVKKYLPHTKLMLFSMRGPALSIDRKKGIRKIYDKILAKYVNKNYDAVFCHYPDAVECFRKEGYNGSIYMQTQVGFNEEWFHPDENARQEIREKFNLGDSYVFGSASRFSPDKGLDDIIQALPSSGNWKFLMMGTGSNDDIDRIRKHINERHLEDKIILTGFVDWYNIAKYWNAIDCAVHVPRTTPHWEETFSLSIVQPMASCKPIIGNTSGSVPYQIGEDGMIVKEGDIKALSNMILWVLNNQEKAANIGVRMYKRAVNCFGIKHLDKMFYDTILDVLEDKFDDAKFDMTKYQTD